MAVATSDLIGWLSECKRASRNVAETILANTKDSERKVMIEHYLSIVCKAVDKFKISLIEIGKDKVPSDIAHQYHCILNSEMAQLMRACGGGSNDL